jgi:hypothetical protein
LQAIVSSSQWLLLLQLSTGAERQRHQTGLP